MSRLRKSATVAAAAVSLVGAWEGLQTVAYQDVVGVPTICYGETKNVRLGMVSSKPECDAMLVRRLIQFEDEMTACLTRQIPDGAHVAFLSLTYNIGSEAFCRSSVARLANEGMIREACDRLLAFNRAGGVVWRGLTNRRKAEREICLKGI